MAGELAMTGRHRRKGKSSRVVFSVTQPGRWIRCSFTGWPQWWIVPGEPDERFEG
jgi:hypothetical protein